MNKKTVKVLALAGVVGVLAAASFSKSFAAEGRVAGDRAYWEGIVGKKYVYSNIVDDRADNYKIHGKVYVCNDWGTSNYKEGWTKGLNKTNNNHIHTDVEKGLNVPGLKCKANYSNDYAEYGAY